jgi:hypothetical protein
VASTSATITRDETSATINEIRFSTVTQSEEIEVERTGSEQEEGTRETEDREREMEIEQVGYKIYETPQPTSRESVGIIDDIQSDSVFGRVT